MKKNLILLFFILFFYGCGGATSTSNSTSIIDDNSSTSSETITYGYLSDSLINGIEYQCGDIKGITGDNGQDGSFQYKSDCVVQFYIGKIYLGDINGTKLLPELKIYPADIVDSTLRSTDTNNTKVVNFARFLQSIDEDDNITNGIVISETTREIFNTVTAHEIDFRTNITLNDELTYNLLKAFPTRTLRSITSAINHLNDTLISDGYTPNSTKPAIPYTLNPITLEPYQLTQIKSSSIKQKTFLLHGEPNTSIWIALNSDGSIPNESSFINLNNLKIGSDSKQIITLPFNDQSIVTYHYFIRLKDKLGNFSNDFNITVTNDSVPPHVQNSNIVEEVLEEQLLFRNVNATDTNGIKGYRIITSSEDNRSIDHEMFTIDTNGTVTFATLPNFDTNINAIYKAIVRAIDIVGNMTDLLLQVRLKNLLDNPPQLTSQNFTTSLTEMVPNGTPLLFELNSTLEQNLTLAPDNDPTLSPIYYHLNNHTDIFDINITTGIITVKDNSNPLFDYEQLPNSIDLNISVENNNTKLSRNGDLNITYATLTVNIVNKIDTAPAFNEQNITEIPEKSALYSSDYPISQIEIDENNSDRNLTMTFAIISGNSGNNFLIDTNTGVIKVNHINSLDYETIKQYILTIRATNIWDDNTTHFTDINKTINITDVRDNPPVIILKTLQNTIPESSIANTNIATFDVNGTIVDSNITTSYEIVAVNKNGTPLNPSEHPFTINTSSGAIVISRQLLSDYNEVLSNFEDTVYTIKAKAQNLWWDGSYNYSNEITFDLNVTNVIDNPPILADFVTVNFDENSSNPIGTLIYDVDTNGTIFDENSVSRFEIVSGDDNNTFEINATTGVITLKKLLDWETNKQFILGIKAINIYPWDSNSTHDSAIKYLTINVNNIIESTPSVTAPTILNIHENIDIGEIIGKIEINNIEEDKKTVDSFTIFSGNSTNKFALSSIKIDDVTGLKYVDLFVNDTLDYETNSSYVLDVNITNVKGSTTKTININVVDDIEKDLPLIIIAIEYDDINLTTTLASIENLVFREETTGSKYLKNYFERVSKGKFYFKAANESYDVNTNGIIKVKVVGEHPLNGTTALDNDIKEALTTADAFIDFSQFDTKNPDGNISSDELQILCIVAGGERTYGDINQSILAKSDAFDIPLTLDGVNVAYKTGGGNFAVVGELQNSNSLTIGLIAKILAKSALNFKSQGDSYTINDFGLMGTGYDGYDGNTTKGTTPVHPSLYNKIIQGWTTPLTLKQARTYNNLVFNYANNVIAYNTFKILDSNNSNIYYLLEYRDASPISTDGNNYDNGLYKISNTLFSGGLKIWKVNNNIGISKILEPVLISNTTDNIFRPTNALTDLPSNNAFEFLDKGTINPITNTYSIGIKTK